MNNIWVLLVIRGWMLKVKRNWNVHRKLPTLQRSKMINDYFAFSSIARTHNYNFVSWYCFIIHAWSRVHICMYVHLSFTIVFNSWLYDQESLEPYVFPTCSRCGITARAVSRVRRRLFNAGRWASEQDEIVVIYYFSDGRKP